MNAPTTPSEPELIVETPQPGTQMNESLTKDWLTAEDTVSTRRVAVAAAASRANAAAEVVAAQQAQRTKYRFD